jgi:tetratricopeptide (TPR) repeat protein
VLSRFRRGRLLPSAFLLLLAWLLSGCASQSGALLQNPDPQLPRRVELTATPFHAQERYQCGPAALSMALGAADIQIAPDALVSQVYVPQREGSLQPEMIASARRNGALAMTIPPRMNALLAEIATGNPVVVLQNLSLPIFPMWHYAVAIGYDLDTQDIVLRSGTTERLTMPLTTFEHTWARSEFWGLVTTPPGRLPATADENVAADALVAYEKTAGPQRAHQAYKAYTAALQRWPHNLTLQMGSGNTAYAAGDRLAAETAFKAATHDHPDNAAAFNNLASVLAELGRLDEAQSAAERAIALGGPWRDIAKSTLADIEARKAHKGR